MRTSVSDFLVIGGGVIGLNLALRVKEAYPDAQVTLLEKESACGLHASGRNSGVLHAGFYYTADSLKSRFCRDGNRALHAYCEQKNILLNRCGKLVVAKNASELDGLQELYRRGQANGVELQMLNAQDAKGIEPRVKTFEQALFSPTTSSVDPQQVMAAMLDDATRAGITVCNNTAYISARGNEVETSQGRFTAGYLINAAGLYADKIARDYGYSQDYRIIPFKGLYLYSDEPPGAIRTHIYPVPNLGNPFLGVHYTLTAQGKIKLGPTAIPAFWREHYQGWGRFNAVEMFEIVAREASLFLRNDFGFRRLALEELAKYSKTRMVSMAAELASDVKPAHYTQWGKPGIRAQLFDLKRRKLEMDFKYEGDDRSFHVLNAVSPAFTCAIPFTQYIFDQIAQKVERQPVSSTEVN
jgi:L-2-hydroxyglutarate oxidase